MVHLHDPTALTLCVIADKISRQIPKMIFAKKTSFPIKDRKSTLYKYNYKKICMFKKLADDLRLTLNIHCPQRPYKGS